ncbi:hypothetical protein E4U41_001338 [Claviceps citrina]|nr:hypothetical protein E4U41_001338 [Claviceps citrina]
MVLQPVADLFNHTAAAGRGCHVSFDQHRYAFTAEAPYRRGEELLIRYGSHSNDALLVEYGFTLPRGLNPWDDLCLDDYLCPRFTRPQRRTLEEAGFWGRYVLDAETVCYRAQTALRMLCLPEPRWRAVLDGQRDEDADADAVDGELRNVLAACATDVERKLVELDRCAAGNEHAVHALRQRWLQIRELVDLAMRRLR